MQIVHAYPELFSRVAMLCPAFIDVTPYSSDAEVDSYAQRTGAGGKSVQKALREFYKDLVLRADWDAYDPVRTAEQVSIDYPPMLVMYNTGDDYGFGEGARRFITAARAQGASVEEASNASGHCETDFVVDMKLADFLQ